MGEESVSPSLELVEFGPSADLEALRDWILPIQRYGARVERRTTDNGPFDAMAPEVGDVLAVVFSGVGASSLSALAKFLYDRLVSNSGITRVLVRSGGNSVEVKLAERPELPADKVLALAADLAALLEQEHGPSGESR